MENVTWITLEICQCETPTDLKSLARGDAGRDGVQSRQSEQRAVLGALRRPQSEALRSILASQAMIMAAREERVSR